MSEPVEDARDVAVPVVGFRTRSSNALEPPRSVESTIRVPSGDHDGVYTFVEGEYTSAAPEPFAFEVYTWVRSVYRAFAPEKANFAPLGDHVPSRLNAAGGDPVSGTGTWFEPSASIV